MYPSYIPASDAGFNNWLVNFDTLLTADPTDFGLVAGDALIVAGVTATWVAAYALAINPATRTTPTIAAKDAARAAAETVVRPFAVAISLNDSVSPELKEGIGVTVRSTTPTPIPAPTTAPELAIQSAIPLQQTLTYKDPAFAGKNKPFGAIGVQIFRSIGVAHATDPVQCTYLDTVTKSPFRAALGAPDQGKAVTYFGRWVTRSGPGGSTQYGPWSAPLNLYAM